MSSQPYFWISAWSLMGLAFAAGWMGIVVSSLMLDRRSDDVPNTETAESE